MHRHYALVKEGRSGISGKGKVSKGDECSESADRPVTKRKGTRNELGY